MVKKVPTDGSEPGVVIPTPPLTTEAQGVAAPAQTTYRALKTIRLAGPLGGVPAGFEFTAAQVEPELLDAYIRNRAVEVVATPDLTTKMGAIPSNKARR